MFQTLGYQSYEDQPRLSARLIVGGIGLLLIGLGGVCVLATIPLSLAATPPALASSSTLRWGLIGVMAGTLLLAVGTIWTGIACFLGRRWVRPIILVISGFGLALAVPAIFSMALAAINPPRTPTTLPALVNHVRWIAVAVMGLFYLLVPGAYLLAFRPKSVQVLLERLDPQPRWTDGLPVPLLGMSAAVLLLGIQLPLAALLPERPVLMSLPLSRALAMVPLGLMMIGMIYAAVKLFQQRVGGWWLAVGITLLLATSSFVNSLVYGSKLYSMVLGPDVSSEIAQGPFGTPRAALISQGVWVATMLIAAIWVKRCCLDRRTTNQSEQAMMGSASSPL